MRMADVTVGLYAWSTRRDDWRFASPIVVADLRMVLVEGRFRHSPIKLRLAPTTRAERGMGTEVGLIALPIPGEHELVAEWVRSGQHDDAMPACVRTTLARAQAWSDYVSSLTGDRYDGKDPLAAIEPGNRSDGSTAFLASSRSLIAPYARYIAERDIRFRAEAEDRRAQEQHQARLSAEYDNLCDRLTVLDVDISVYGSDQFGNVSMTRESFRRLVELAEKGSTQQ